MKNTRELLAAVKKRHSLTSDYQLGKYLGISKQRISGYQSGANTLGDAAAIKVADALEIDRGRVLAIIAAERTQSEEAKREWLKLAGTAAAVILSALAWTFCPDLDSGNVLIAFVTAAAPIDAVYWLYALAMLFAALALFLQSARNSHAPYAR